MVDLIVPAGSTLVIDQNYAVAPRYGLFSMGAGAKIAVAVDVTISADRAQVAASCVIDARGTAGVNGGGAGGAGGPGQNGRIVTIIAALTSDGSLPVFTD